MNWQSAGLLLVSAVAGYAWQNGGIKLPKIAVPGWVRRLIGKSGPEMVPSPSVDHFRDELARIDKAIEGLQKERALIVEQAQTEAAMHAEWASRLEALQ